VVNVGRRPTFKEAAPVLAEAHVIDWSGELYGKRVELSFLHHLREERRFPDVASLQRQIAADRDEARRRLAAG
jgi:riboflavin kinase/FMN adenylyltransferase